MDANARARFFCEALKTTRQRKTHEQPRNKLRMRVERKVEKGDDVLSSFILYVLCAAFWAGAHAFCAGASSWGLHKKSGLSRLRPSTNEEIAAYFTNYKLVAIHRPDSYFYIHFIAVIWSKIKINEMINNFYNNCTMPNLNDRVDALLLDQNFRKCVIAYAINLLKATKVAT